MENDYTNEDFFHILMIFNQNGQRYLPTCRSFNAEYPDKRRLDRRFLKKIITNLRTSGQFKVKRNRNCYVTRQEDNEFNVLLAVTENPNISIRQLEVQFDISYSSIQKILKRNSQHPYKYSIHQKLLPGDFPRRTAFCEWFMIKNQEDPEFWRKVIWSDEASFTNNGIFNRHNAHYWSTQNLHLTKPSNFQIVWKFNVWVGLINNQLIGPVVYDQNLNAAFYSQNILPFLEENYLDNLPLATLREIYFMQDGAPPHNARVVDRLLSVIFEDRWIGNSGPIRWPARSPDLNPLDFFYGVTLKIMFMNSNAKQERLWKHVFVKSAKR